MRDFELKTSGYKSEAKANTKDEPIMLQTFTVSAEAAGNAKAIMGERAALNARQPLGRLVTAEEVAAGIAYLASPLAASVTGTALAIDGGMAGLRIRPRS